MMSHRFKLIPAAYLLLLQEDRILLQRRANTGYEDGNWGLPSGHFQGDESAIAAMVREAMEEIGIDIDPNDVRMVHVMHRRGSDGGLGPENERVDFFFALSRWSGDPVNREPQHCDGLEWFSLTNLPDNTIGYIREAISNYQAGRFYSERGW